MAARSAIAAADGAWLELRPDPHGSWRASALPARLQVAFRSLDGRVAGLPGGKRLKACCKPRPPAVERGAVPLLYARGRLIAVGDQWQATEVSAPVAEAAGGRRSGRLRLHWHGARPVIRHGAGPRRHRLSGGRDLLVCLPVVSSGSAMGPLTAICGGISMTRFVFVTGGVVSSLGKGIAAALAGR